VNAARSMILESIIVSLYHAVGRLSVLYHFVIIKYITLVKNWLFCVIALVPSKLVVQNFDFSYL